MRAIIYSKSEDPNKSLEDIVDELLNDKKLLMIEDPQKRKAAKVQKLRNELRRYLPRPRMYAQQIAFIRAKIAEIQS